jgi:hypothetical protein
MPNQVAVLGELLPDDLRHDATAPVRATSRASGCTTPAPQKQHGLVGERWRQDVRDRRSGAEHGG